ncbi:MAG: glycosyltransferase [Candidatus Omnitrophica bacterium]|nr:glycosyltransferase [Candidatus Omnitrophota bacterium]
MRQELIEFGIDPLHIEQIPTGVDASHFSLGHSLNSSQVVCVARLSPEKGIDTLLSAWRLVIDQVPEAKLVILGDGPAREQLQKQIRELNLVGVEFMGQVQDVLPYLQRSGIFVLPSRSEGLPNALLQAMATGLACVATTVGGIPEVIQQGGNGYLVAPGDPNALSERLLELLADPEKRHRMGLAARQTVETHYTMDAMVERYLQCYQSDEVDLAKQKMPLDPITEGTYVIGEEK